MRRLRADLVFVLSGRLGLAGTFGGEAAAPARCPSASSPAATSGPRGFRYDAVGPQVAGRGRRALRDRRQRAGARRNAELRYNLTRAFQLASFLDLGNVYPEARDLELRELRRSAGLGVRYRTPIGPIRLDWGYVLDHREGESRSQLHLTIGHAF